MADKGWTWKWQRCGRYKYQKVLVRSTNSYQLVPSVARERRVPPGSRPVRGREEAMQYHQWRILCALRTVPRRTKRGARSGIAKVDG